MWPTGWARNWNGTRRPCARPIAPMPTGTFTRSSARAGRWGDRSEDCKMQIAKIQIERSASLPGNYRWVTRTPKGFHNTAQGRGSAPWEEREHRRATLKALYKVQHKRCATPSMRKGG